MVAVVGLGSGPHRLEGRRLLTCYLKPVAPKQVTCASANLFEVISNINGGLQ